MNVNNRVAICVTSVFCIESYLVEPRKVGANSDRARKWISGIPRNQEWERMESLFCLTLNEMVLYAQITAKNAISFQTMISPSSTTNTAPGMYPHLDLTPEN